jgi:hypothetical protein
MENGHGLRKFTLSLCIGSRRQRGPQRALRTNIIDDIVVSFPRKFCAEMHGKQTEPIAVTDASFDRSSVEDYFASNFPEWRVSFKLFTFTSTKVTLVHARASFSMLGYFFLIS